MIAEILCLNFCMVLGSERIQLCTDRFRTNGKVIDEYECIICLLSNIFSSYFMTTSLSEAKKEMTSKVKMLHGDA